MAIELRDVLASLRVVSLPLRTRFRGVTFREAALFEGPQGYAEFAPFLEYGDDEAAYWLASALEFGWSPTPDPVRESIRVNASLPAVQPDAVAEVLAQFGGCDTVKIKVAEIGQSLDDDLARVRTVRELLGDDVRIRLDANGGWTVDEAAQAIEVLAPLDLEYVEQPCTTVPELLALRREIEGLGVFIAADESVRKAEDPLAVARAGAADILVIKAAPLGGIRRALDIIARAELPAVVSSALDTSVGISMGLHLAVALPRLELACGLGTAALLAADVTDDPLIPESGALPVRRVAVSERLLDTRQADTERVHWWQARIERCFDAAAELLQA